MINQIFYAHKQKSDRHGEFFCHIYAWPEAVKMCGSGKIYKVKIREVRPGEKSQYWGWFDNEKKEYSMIYPSEPQARMCFPYGVDAAEKDGKGRLVNLVIEEVEPG